MSLARNSTAFSSRSLTARTTGAPLARSRRLSDVVFAWLRCRLAGRRDVVFAQPLVKDDREVLGRRDFDANAGAEHNLRRPARRHVARVRNRKNDAAVGGPIRENHGLAQVTLRERRHQWRRRHQVLQRDTLQKSVELGPLVCELDGRQVGELPQLGLTIGSTACPAASLPPSTAVKYLL